MPGLDQCSRSVGKEQQQIDFLKELKGQRRARRGESMGDGLVTEVETAGRIS